MEEGGVCYVRTLAGRTVMSKTSGRSDRCKGRILMASIRPAKVYDAEISETISPGEGK